MNFGKYSFQIGYSKCLYLNMTILNIYINHVPEDPRQQDYYMKKQHCASVLISKMYYQLNVLIFQSQKNETQSELSFLPDLQI